MTTATTTTVINHTATANYRVWVAEIIAQLLAVGLTQTADTGQVNTATVTKPAGSTLNAYAIFRFNDTAQATSPVFIKLRFGTGNGTANSPGLNIQVGTGSNGAGTLTGSVTDEVAVSNWSDPASTVATYLSRFCYSATAGYLGMTWKIGASGVNISLGGFHIYRSADNTATVTTDSVHLLSNGNNAVGITSSAGYLQVISYLNSTVYSSAFSGSWPNPHWTKWPLLVPQTSFAGNVQTAPVYQYTPVLGITPWLGLCAYPDIALSATFSKALVGAVAHTFINAGMGLGATNMTADSQTILGICGLWE